jgi:hypothetical protein
MRIEIRAWVSRLSLRFLTLHGIQIAVRKRDVGTHLENWYVCRRLWATRFGGPTHRVGRDLFVSGSRFVMNREDGKHRGRRRLYLTLRGWVAASTAFAERMIDAPSFNAIGVRGRAY